MVDRSLRGRAAHWTLWCAWGVVGVMVLERLLSDRFLWSQYLSWTPAWILGVLALGLALLAWLLGGRTPRGRRALLALAPAICALGPVLWLDLRWQNALLGPSPRAGEASMRMLVWNPAIWSGPDVPAVLDERVDFVAVTNATQSTRWTQWRERLEGSGQPDQRRRIFAAQTGLFTVFSRYPIVRWGYTTFSMTREGQVQIDEHRRRGGALMFMELETDLIQGRPMVVWFVDMPSSIQLRKGEVMIAARQAAATWRGPVMVRRADGQDEMVASTMPGFPDPDVITGDFNVPRGVWSVDQLTPKRRMRDSFAQAGWALSPFAAAGFPRQWSLWHLGQTLLSEELEATGSRLIDPGYGRHRIQLVDVRARNKPG